MTKSRKDDLVSFTTDIVAAHVSNNPTSAGEVPELINSVYATLTHLDATTARRGGVPAVPIGASIQPGHLVCLEDGKKLLTLKRHLADAHSMTPDEYRLKWGLPADYPMVIPRISKERSAIARKIGLGRKRAKTSPLSE